jgi:hypothetical protein
MAAAFLLGWEAGVVLLVRRLTGFIRPASMAARAMPPDGPCFCCLASATVQWACSECWRDLMRLVGGARGGRAMGGVKHAGSLGRLAG